MVKTYGKIGKHMVKYGKTYGKLWSIHIRSQG